MFYKWALSKNFKLWKFVLFFQKKQTKYSGMFWIHIHKTEIFREKLYLCWIKSTEKDYEKVYFGSFFIWNTKWAYIIYIFCHLAYEQKKSLYTAFLHKSLEGHSSVWD